MRCPYCTADDTRVVDSRPADAGGAIRRRRECTHCGHRFTTYERPTVSAMVRKRSGEIEPFDPGKLRRGVENALADRPVSPEAIEALVAGIADRAHAGGVVGSDDIGHEVLEGLRRLDEVAYLRFKSVYDEFQGASDFGREVAALETEA